ncbi:MAG: galactokinase [Bacilli bacterium]
MEKRVNYLIDHFKKEFECSPSDIFSSPGRIELCGNHTDHNNGKVLVSSIDLNILAAVRKRDDNIISFISEGFDKIDVDLNDLTIKESEFGKSISLIKGVVFKLKELGYKVGGFEAFANSTIFKGAGVSSSAAFEVLIAKIESYYFNNDSIEAFKLAQVAQFAESVYFNKPCGLLDQSGIALGGINYIDFKSETNPVIKNIVINIPDYQFILINTGDEHTHLTHCYAAIKDDMKKVSEYFGVEKLRFADYKEFSKQKEDIINKLGTEAYLRAKHYFEENERVAKAFEGLEKKDYITLFEMMDESGISSYNQLKNCYVENEEEKLPMALKFVKTLPVKCYSRVHGGGFAGTMLMIISKDELSRVLSTLNEKFGEANVMLVSLSDKGTCHLYSL